MRFILFIAILPFALGVASAQSVDSLDDIQFWTGSGTNRAALVLDWNGASMTDTSWVWGYRWDGAATVEDMFFSVVTTDPRVFAKVSSPGAFGVSLYGIGYDNGDLNFGLDDGTVFDANGFAIDPSSRDGAAAMDVRDEYAEGWLSNGFWSLSTAADNPFDGGIWLGANTGISGQSVDNESWNGLAFATGFVSPSVAANPQAAAVPEPSALAVLSVVSAGVVWNRRRRSRKGRHVIV